ncbi:MAG: LuxR C-terminal-related transcriptional regulator [Prevotellaceae bacterium]|nr:LuxR C-terminal-related transcriptional regulator [Prevotellaceae bacterium]
MNLLLPEHKLSTMLLQHQELISVAARCGIELGLGDKTTREVCASQSIDVDFFVALLNTVSHERYYAEQLLRPNSTLLLVDYLKKTHVYYRQALLPVAQVHVQKLMMSAGVSNRILQQVEERFSQFEEKILRFFSQVEEELFAYIKHLYNNNLNLAAGRAIHEVDVELFGSDMVALRVQSDKVKTLLWDSLNLLVKDLVGNFDRPLRNAAIFHISAIEKDFSAYIRLLERLLSPAILDMRNNLISKKLENIFRHNSQHVDASENKELSEREREILALIAKGLKSKEVAQQLNISRNTVQAHRKNISAKLGLKTISELTVYAVMNGVG